DRFKANAEVKIGQIVDRLERQAEQLEAKVKTEADANAKVKEEKDVADVKARLEANMQAHVQRFQQVIDKAPEQARPALQAALEAKVKDYAGTLQALGDSQVNAEAKLKARGTVEAEVHGTVASVDATGGKLVLKLNDGSTKELNAS